MRICFVCLGNICRSPTAEGVVRHLLREQGAENAVALDSAGTGAWHVGHAPDSRSAATAARRGIHLEGRARQFSAGDFADFDMILAMDAENLADLRALAPDQAAADKVQLFLDFAPGHAKEDVPDPYYGGDQGFEEVVDLCLAAGEGLLAALRERGDL